MSERFLGAARLLAALFVVGIPLFESAAQDRYGEIALRNSRPTSYHEAVVLPAGPNAGEASAQVAVLFRVPHPLLVFVQDGDGFLTSAEVVVELYRKGEKIDESVWRGERRASSFEQTRSSEEDLTGRVLFRVDPGNYTYRIELIDESSGIRSGPPSRVDVPQFDHGGIGTPFFIADSVADSTSITIQPVNLGGDAPFGQAARMAVPVAFDGDDATLEYSLYRIADERGFRERRADRRREGNVTEIELSAEDVRVREGSIDLDAAAPIFGLEAACFCWEIREAAPGRLAWLDLETESLESGAYVLDLMLRTDKETLQHRAAFETHWRNMPLSLYDVDVAIRNLSFIESREQIRGMLRGSQDDKIAALRAYWSERDPSPGSMANELMEEYYGRVDHAASEFRTGKTPFPDGLRTDAARIYIVHGPPDDISSSFPSTGGVQQTWTYPDGRQFIFWASSSLEPLVLEETSMIRGGENGS